MHLLRNAGNEVTITVEYLREAPAFLKLPLGKWEEEKLQGAGEIPFLPHYLSKCYRMDWDIYHFLSVHSERRKV